MNNRNRRKYHKMVGWGKAIKVIIDIGIYICWAKKRNN